MSESGNWPSQDRRAKERNEAVGGPAAYNKQVETRTIRPHPDDPFIPASSTWRSYSTQTTTTTTTTTRNTEIDMRTFSLRGLFGVNASLTSSVPGRVSVSFVSTRAHSEPLISHQLPQMDVEMADDTTSTTSTTAAPKPRRAQSEYIIQVPDERMEVEGETKTYPPVIRRDYYNTPQKGSHPQSNVKEAIGASAETSKSQHVPRAPSPAMTEVDDPESQDIVADIQTRGVKIVDFAYAPPYVRPAPLPPVATPGSSVTPIPIPAENDNTAYITTTPTPTLRPATEIFDPYAKITEVDYRWSQSPRTHPVPGKSLRRLLDLGWITPSELAARAAPMDLAALEAFDARKPVYPWKSIKWSGVAPSEGERKDMCNARRSFWAAMDRMKERVEMEERKRKAEEERIGRAFNTGGVKRALDAGEEEEGDVELKKRRLSPEPSNPSSRSNSQSPSRPPPTHTMMPPAKQYPAPLHTYNPEIYPDAASIIESSSQSSSQQRPVFPPAPERSDTPPVDENGEIVVGVGKGKSESNIDGEETAGELDDKLGSSSTSPAGRGTRLVHPRERKKMTRALSRTQTFAQL